MTVQKGLTILAILTLSVTGMSQNYLGVHSSNYAGVMGTDLNPASFVDSRFKVDINLGSFNVNAYQNAMSFNTDVLGKWWVKSFKPDVNGDDNPHNNWQNLPTENFINSNYSETTEKTLGFYNNMQVDVLNFMFHVNPKVAVGFTGKFRTITTVDNVDPKLAVLVENELNAPSLWGQTLNEKLLNMNHMSWMEYGIIYSQVLKDDGEHFLKMGAKAKWLSGYSSAYMNTTNFSYNLQNTDTSLNLSGDFDYGYSTGVLSEEDISLNSASKFGLGLDLGFVYEWRPNWKVYKYDMDGETNIWRKDQEKYKIRAGVSLLDLGGMKFEKGEFSNNLSINSSNAFDLTVFEGAEGPEGANAIIDSLVLNDPNWSRTNQDDTYFMNTPTALSLQFDYHIWKWFYVNTTGIISLQNRKNVHRVRVANQVSVTPSFDFAWLGIGVPMSYNKYSGFKAGLGTRLGPLTIGVTDFNTLLATGDVNGAEVYAGLRLPILYNHPSDIDADLVSDKLDECLTVPGLWKFRGCPDSDNDGIKDTEDLCPNDPGLAYFQGCPDSDNDSIPDKDDACPEVFGKRAFNGCPDRDNDSVIDTKDDCPDIAGLKEFNGCPDTDGDGIKDEDDACPEVAGTRANNGCPDTDGDGLFDFIDNCPTQFGPKENNGCPWPDTDGDGLLDKDDKCPYLAGPILNEGCPYQDTDEDGVLDKDDKCPSVVGPIENDGCPIIEEEVQEILKTAFENLEFETGKDVITQGSIPSLAELAQVLLKKTEWKLQISGHTDNIGGAQTNLILSKKRAESVKAFMISKAIDADRLMVLYFGETQEIADNATSEGRQKNRRVEMTIIFE
ncbi:MAG: DUF5723 family protein [Crocinitomicaceae bacterium]|nr:DUF5723 family protein [Crocinitomicaceae bacterium]